MNHSNGYPFLETWPLVLAGPLLRRTEPTAVTVWLALKTACRVTLTIYTTTQHSTLGEKRLLGEGCTVACGQRLHVVAVTARPLGAALQSGELYAYDLQFTPIEADVADAQPLSLEQATTPLGGQPSTLSYFPHQKPTFALPPQQFKDLRLVHASCRKPHGDGFDALPILDSLIEAHADQPLQRPHQLFLTGDQIYGDDVAEPLLWAATQLGDALLGWKEDLPVDSPSPTRNRQSDTLPHKLVPGQRAAIATHKGGFTAGMDGKSDKVNSHLLSLGEFFATYLLVWSPVCWPTAFPQGEAMMDSNKATRRWYREVDSLQQFAHTLWKVRRALANVPTYTLFDDHDVSDDWNLNQSWCLRVLGQPLGQRTVQNALTACALFQGWGNTPSQFQTDQPGAKLLQAVEDWSASHGNDELAYGAITRYLGLPPTDPTTQLPQFVQAGSMWVLQRHPESLTWYYSVQSECHEVIALDTRTWRGFPVDGDVLAPPMILCHQALEDQVQGLLRASQTGPQVRSHPAQPQPVDQRITLLISPTNLFSLKAIDWVQEYQLKRGNVFSADVGDAWNIPSDALAAFLVKLFEQRRQLVVLSGDIHYSFAVRLSFAEQAARAADPAVMIQLTSSPLKNEETLTRLIHTRLKQWLLPERSRYWLGWSHPPHLQECSKSQLRQLSQRRKPDWTCLLDWIPRQPAQVPSFGANISWLLHPKENGEPGWLKALPFWGSRWFQDGREVVGLNNLSLVQFEAGHSQGPCEVIQDVYWFSTRASVQIRCSRFASPLAPVRGMGVRA
ncbi:MAG: PhoD-like phosphatase [Cyanobacteria bacterium Co-bin13]|nr:PhoD-like phosphatase [Cyanobacteria bacterium Co-bin13]